MIPQILCEGRMKPDNWHVVFTGYVVIDQDRSDAQRHCVYDWLGELERNGRHWTQAGPILWFEHFDDAAEFFLRFKQVG